MSLATHCFVLGAAFCAGPLLAVASAPAPDGGVVLVLSPPWAASEEIVHQSHGRLLGPDTGRFATFAVSEAPGFASRLKKHGAWFVLDGTKMAQLCGVEE